MNRDKAIQIAREITGDAINWEKFSLGYFLEAFGTRAEEIEREECAKVCDRMAKRIPDIRSAALEMAAENIRARGNV